MPVTTKGVPPYDRKADVPTSLFMWLQKLQLLFPKTSTFEATLNPSNVVANSELTETYTVTGLSVEDIVVVNPPTLTAGIGIVYARVSATDTLQIRWRNFTGSDINLASGTYLIAATRL
jgi:hypothetical protein